MATRPSMRDRVRQQATAAASEGASYLKLEKKINFFAPNAKDEFELDFLPFENDKPKHPKGYLENELIAFVRFRVHNGIGAEDNKYICPTSFGEKCPICEARKSMARSSKADPELLKDLTPKERIIFQLIDLKDEKKGVQLWDVSWHLFGKQLLADIEKSENRQTGRKRSLAHGGFADLEDGQTLFVTFKAKSFKGKDFFEVDRIDAENRDSYDEKVLDDVINLDDALKVLTYDELEAVFLELDPAEQGANRVREEKKDDDKPERTTSRRSSRSEDKEEDKQEETTSRRRGRSEEKKEEPADPPEEKTSSRRRGASNPPPEEKKEKTPSKPSRRNRESAKDEPKCYAGGTFGEDRDTFLGGKDDEPIGHPNHEPNCYDCTVYKECTKAGNK